MDQLVILDKDRIPSAKVQHTGGVFRDQHTIVRQRSREAIRVFKMNIAFEGMPLRHHNELYLFLFALGSFFELDIASQHVYIIRNVIIPRQALHDLGIVIRRGDSHEVILVDMLILLGHKVVDRVFNGKAAEHQGSAAHDARHGHKQSLFVAEQVSHGHLV